MKKIVLNIDSKDSKKLMEVLGEMIEKQSVKFNPISKDKIELSA